MKQYTVFFSHGKESGPNGRKILALAAIAKSFGLKTEAPSYEGMEQGRDRIAKLTSLAENTENLILVGSSMGAYISSVASESLKPAAVFLLAPAFYIPGYEIQEPVIHSPKTEIVHGWNDELIPASAVFRYAEKFQIPLHLLPSGHRLENVIPELERLFRSFLESMIQN
ncbi:MAG TPA: YqiA/YcfP family alpha/beta fold hydrolase [Leptospiraceae bacterium]|nr:YqiA/YcfP family alpha/beta fold hydrolase [Leptospiraceae bacterium]